MSLHSNSNANIRIRYLCEQQVPEYFENLKQQSEFGLCMCCYENQKKCYKFRVFASAQKAQE